MKTSSRLSNGASRSLFPIVSRTAALLAVAVLAASTAPANTIYRPGLMQVLFKQGSANGFPTATSGVPVLASNIVAAASSDSYASDAERVAYPLMDRSNNVVNEVTGTTWTWPNQYATFAYEGEILVQAGTTYTIYGRFDDGSALVIDGSVVLLQREDSGYNKAPQVWGNWTATRTGWVPFNAWAWDWTGGKAVVSCYYAFQFNTNGVNNDFNNSSKWSRFIDPGDMSSLRVRAEESYTTVDTVAKSGSNLNVTLRCAGLPSDATIQAFFGPSDAGENVSAWGSSVSLGTVTANPSGTVTASFVIPGAATATAMRFRLEGQTGMTSYYVEWTDPVALTADPIVSISAVDPTYTGGIATVNLSAFGVGATSDRIFLEIAETENGFDDPLKTVAYPGNPVSHAGVYEVPFSGLVTNTTYWVRAVATTDQSGEGTSVPVSFTTLDPAPPEGGASPLARGFTSLTATGVVTAFGAGSNSATIRLEVSTDADFATLTGTSDELNAPLDETIQLVVPYLPPAREYHVRARIVNTWGIATYVPIENMSTLDVPILSSGIGWSSQEPELIVTFGVTEVFDAAECTATLYYGDTPDPTALQGSRLFSAPGSLQWPGIPALSKTAYAKVVVTSSVGGVNYSAVWTAEIAPGSSSFALSSFTSLGSTIFRVGDKAVLPELATSHDYYVLFDPRPFTLGEDGRTLTAVEPGFTTVAVYEYNATTGQTERNPVMQLGIVRPEPVDNGDVFLAVPTTTKWSWDVNKNWKKLTNNYTKKMPYRPNDVAIVPMPNGGEVSIDYGDTIGEIYIGFDASDIPGGSYNSSIRLHSSSGNRLTFQSTDRKRPALLRYCNFGDRDVADRRPHIYLGSGSANANNLAIQMESDMIWDCGAYPDYTDSEMRDRYGRYRCGTESGRYWDVPEGKTLRIVNMTGFKSYGDDQGPNASFWLGAKFPFTGKGTIIYEGPGSTCVNSPFQAFEGTIVVRNKQQYANYSMGSRGGSFWMRNWSFPQEHTTNATLVVEGHAGYNGGLQDEVSSGVISYGNSHGYGSWGFENNVFPEKGVIMNGGYLSISGMNNNSATWREDGTTDTETIAVPNHSDRLVISNGFSHIELFNSQSSVDRPTNQLAFAALEHTGDGTLSVKTDRMRNSYNKSLARDYVVIHGFNAHAIGGTGRATYSFADAEMANVVPATAPIVPWIITYVQNVQDLRFPAAAADGNLVAPGHPTAKALNDADDPTENIRSKDKSIAIDHDVTVNSLILEGNYNKGQTLGAGRTLTIGSGGLILGSSSLERIDTQAEYNAGTQGTLRFPGKAYIYTARNNDNEPNEIWAKIVAPQGAVFSYPLDLLVGGDQTGIDKRITVNGTDLRLGSRDGTTGCIIDVPVHLYGGNSRLSILKEGSFCQQELHFHDHGTPGSTFVPQPGTIERVHKLYIDGVSRPRGYYGSSEADVESLATQFLPAFVDDHHFSGTGVTLVLRDDLRVPTLTIIY